MQIVRLIIWLLIIVAVVLFSFVNWDERATVHIWTDLVWDTRLPAVVIVSFLLGMVPTWLLHRGTKWRLNRRITNLENAARSAALARHNPGSGSSDAKPIVDTSAKDDSLKPTQDKPA